jgi:hypothetical protein
MFDQPSILFERVFWFPATEFPATTTENLETTVLHLPGPKPTKEPDRRIDAKRGSALALDKSGGLGKISLKES